MRLFQFCALTFTFVPFTYIISLLGHLLDWLYQATPHSVSDSAGGHGDQIDL